MPGLIGALRPMASLLAPGGWRGRLSILVYHRVLPSADPLRPYDPEVAAFRSQMELVSTLFQVLPLAEAVRRLRADRLPPRALCITFDDGYADNCEVALPILRELELPATFFIAVGYLDGGVMFNDRLIEAFRGVPVGPLDLSAVDLGQRVLLEGDADRLRLIGEVIQAVKHLDDDERNERVEALVKGLSGVSVASPMMGRDQLRALVGAGMEVGGHTRNHPILSRVSRTRARAEIGQGREELESILGCPVRLFAYPNGHPGRDYGPHHVAMVRACGFEAAVSMVAGVSGRRTDPYQLARFTPWSRHPAAFAGRLVHNLTRLYVP
ncbi:polysaccharide deacetylase family protein [Halorhodospira sp. M38]|uniref:polysaccharide deacetylase family protein n=1 Tax=unclassified Halorhodospira TaxID=2626748 RepID=UPI003FCD59B3